MSRNEIETHWTINDVWDANTVLDLHERLEDIQAEKAEYGDRERKRM